MVLVNLRKDNEVSPETVPSDRKGKSPGTKLLLSPEERESQLPSEWGSGPRSCLVSLSEGLCDRPLGQPILVQFMFYLSIPLYCLQVKRQLPLKENE